MTLRIDTMHDGPRVLLRLSGRIRAENLDDLAHRVAGGGSVGLDLDEVTLVDVDAVRFLKDAESTGIELHNCPPYIREWIDRERDVDGLHG